MVNALYCSDGLARADSYTTTWLVHLAVNAYNMHAVLFSQQMSQFSSQGLNQEQVCASVTLRLLLETVISRQSDQRYYFSAEVLHSSGGEFVYTRDLPKPTNSKTV